jgi:hypothetical protein
MPIVDEQRMEFLRKVYDDLKGIPGDSHACDFQVVS